jgi:GT2 family glycosyltransferase
VNYNGKIYLENLFDSLANLDYPKEKLQIIMVDNASQDDSVSFTEKNYPFVKIIPCKKNNGFAEGNNIGVRYSQGEIIAIINNDCVADRKWLITMVNALLKKEEELNKSKERYKNIGAIGSKIFFYFKYYPLKISFGTNNTAASENEDTYGIIDSIKVKSLYDSIRDNNERIDILLRKSIKYLDGTKPVSRKDNGDVLYKVCMNSVIAIPLPNDNPDLNMTIDISHMTPGNMINIGIGDKVIFSSKILNTRQNFSFDIKNENTVFAKDLINSTGSTVNKRFYAKEINYEKFEVSFEPTGEYKDGREKSEGNLSEVFAIPGTGFLCRKSVLDEIGFFEKKFFTYYEDIDFFWRLKLNGYRSYICEDSILRHFHCGSGTEWSYNFTYYVLRNRLLMIYRCAWFKAFLKNYLSFTASAFISFLYMILSKLRKTPVSRIDVPIRMKIFFEFFLVFFSMLPGRIKIRKNAKVKDKEIVKWFND